MLLHTSLVLIFNTLCTVVINGQPLNYGQTLDIYHSSRPHQRPQRSFPGFYNNDGRGKLYQQMGPVSRSPVYRRHAYMNESPSMYSRTHYEPEDLPQYEQPYRGGQQYREREKSQLIVLPRGVDEEYAMYPLKTKTIEGFDEEDQDMIQEEEMGDALTLIDSQAPTRYVPESIMKKAKSVPTYQMEMASPMQRQRYNPPSGGYSRMPPMMLPQQEDYEYVRYNNEEIYSPMSHHQQKRYQPNYQYYQNYNAASDDYYPAEFEPRYVEGPEDMYTAGSSIIHSRRAMLPKSVNKEVIDRDDREIIKDSSVVEDDNEDDDIMMRVPPMPMDETSSDYSEDQSIKQISEDMNTNNSSGGSSFEIEETTSKPENMNSQETFIEIDIIEDGNENDQNSAQNDGF